MTKIQIKPVIATKQQDIFSIPDSIIPADKRLFYPNWDNKPPYKQNIITVDNKRVLTTGNILSMVSRPAAGKSSGCECILSSIINPKCDTLGFTVTPNSGRNKALYIDTERTVQDTWGSWERVYKRANIKPPTVDNRIIVVNAKAIAIGERKTTVEQILKDNMDIGLVIFDGACDFIRDVNSINEATDFIDWINTFNPNISIVATIHTNPNDEKPRGHIGSELCRRAESVFLIRKVDDGVREITTTFNYGKVRNDDDTISTFFKWSDDLQMFISAAHQRKCAKDQEKEKKYGEMAQEIFTGKSILSFSQIINDIMEKTKKEYDPCKQIFFRHFKDKLVDKTNEGWKIVVGTK
jgi:hypothetical protein